MGADTLDLAYKYPFSRSAGEVLSAGKQKGIEPKYLEFAKERIDSDISGKNRYYNISLDNIKEGDVKSYVYARMIVSATKNPILIDRFCKGEANRSRYALVEDTDSNMIRVAGELGIKMKENKDNEFLIGFADLLRNMPNGEEYMLVNSRITKGIVILRRAQAANVVAEAAYKSMRKGLPIPAGDLPKHVRDYSKGLKFDIKIKITKKTGRGTEWIDRLLKTPIPDVRHRTVNLILAPYLTNVRGLDVEQAYGIIKQYIEDCKGLNPDTRINDSYIKYQCKYAKDHGMKPLSLRRAKELLEGLVGFDDKK